MFLLEMILQVHNKGRQVAYTGGGHHSDPLDGFQGGADELGLIFRYSKTPPNKYFNI